MSYEHLRWAWRQTVGNPGRKSVLVALADASGEDGRSFRGQASLAAMTDQGQRTVRRHLAWLEDNGYIRRSARFRDDGSRTSDDTWLPPVVEGEVAPLWTTGQSGQGGGGTTGQSGQGPRPTETGPPANLAGQEPPGEPLEEPPATPTPSEDAAAYAGRPAAGAAGGRGPEGEANPEPPPTPTGLWEREAYAPPDPLAGEMDPNAKGYLRRTDPDAADALARAARGLKWAFRHESLAAQAILLDREKGLYALREATIGCDGVKAAAWRYFAAVYGSERAVRSEATPAAEPEEVRRNREAIERMLAEMNTGGRSQP